MKQLYISFIACIFGLFCTQDIYAQTTANNGFDSIAVIQQGAQLVKLPARFGFAEGPASDKYGNIYFTDQPNDNIWLYDTSGRLTVFMHKTGHSNGLYIDNGGNIIACADEQNELWSISKAKKIQVLLTGFHGHRFNGPNDLWVDQQGGIYFTDPYYQRPYWKTNPSMKGQKVYYLANGSRRAVVADQSLLKPNGIAGTGDGKYLYVSDIEADKTYRFQIDTNGALTNKQLFVSQGSDGLKLDNQGNVYLCGKGISIYNAVGKRIGYIPVPADWVGNACFGGKDKNMLFITASESVYTLQMTVNGM